MSAVFESNSTVAETIRKSCETSVIVAKGEEEDLLSLRANGVELRKDLLLDNANYLEAVAAEDDGLFKSEPLVVEVDTTADVDQQRCQSYVTLTSLPTVIQHDNGDVLEGTETVNNEVSNFTNLLNFGSSWASVHEEGMSSFAGSLHHHLAPCHFQRNSMEMSMQEFPHSSYVMPDDPFKSSVPLGPNPLYHLDANNRRIWVPESSRGGTDRISTAKAKAVSMPESGIFMAADLENDEILLQQHVVNIERFPNRCWPGGAERSTSSRSQYEKGIYFCHLNLQPIA